MDKGVIKIISFYLILLIKENYLKNYMKISGGPTIWNIIQNVSLNRLIQNTMIVMVKSIKWDNITMYYTHTDFWNSTTTNGKFLNLKKFNKLLKILLQGLYDTHTYYHTYFMEDNNGARNLL